MPMRSPSSGTDNSMIIKGDMKKMATALASGRLPSDTKNSTMATTRHIPRPVNCQKAAASSFIMRLQAGAEDRNQHYAHQRPDGDNLPKRHGLAKQFDERIIERNDDQTERQEAQRRIRSRQPFSKPIHKEPRQ